MYFHEDLKRSLGQSASQEKWIWIGNIEVEQHWRDESLITLPGSGISSAQALVNQMGEMALFLADSEDVICLKTLSDPDFIAYVSELRGDVPQVMVCPAGQVGENITESILQSPELLAALRQKGAEGYKLMPYGTSALEEQLSAQSQLPLVTPAAATCMKVNSKIYSRLLADRTGIRQVPGVAATSLTELEAGFAQMESFLTQGPLVVKDAMGVSGKGMILIDSPKRFSDLMKMLRRNAKKRGSEKIAMIIETWIDKTKDLNYQFLINSDKKVTFITAREALVRDGVHFGHVYPPQLTEEQQRDMHEAVRKIGHFLADDGYYGVVGIDAMVGADGYMYPCLEINARFNMSTFQNRIHQEWMGSDCFFIARPYNIGLKERITFAKLREALDTLLYHRGDESGVIIQAFSTLNLEDDQGELRKGRLYTLLVGRSLDECNELSGQIGQILSRFGSITP
ncbi:ATP-grasp domain-containing protein [Paenibacillus sp.]|jgi:D-alanine-D-alanine ligase-like ATP-grasp enzyme|uniref:preATP grasp domain-containing protein n=1 Tax=Paenibacillus sp. TaxID=58172 RepID=UPI00283408FF|nr:ATP-grasp domain-containing protein [Paenibacillus sp.]MDR0267463.1 ATP-grasp domain-containing protein [Paenibacillus sp.]